MEKYTGHFILLLATLAWTTAGLFVRVVSTDIPTTLLWRSFFGALFLLALYFFIKKNVNLKQALTFSKGEFVIGTITCCGMTTFVSAFFYTTIANVTFAYGIVPLTTYGMALIFLKEKLRLLAILCCGLAIMGVSIMVTANLNLEHAVGIGLGLMMTLSVSGMTIAAKFYTDADPIKSAYLAGFLGAIIMIPFATYGNISASDFSWLVLYGFLNVSVGFGLYLWGIKRCDALTGSLITLSEIPLAPLWAFILFAEVVTFGTFIGGFFIISAVLIYIIAGKK